MLKHTRQEVLSKWTRREIESAVIAQFGTKKKLAELLGMSQSQLSRSLKKLSESFIQRLKGIGLVIDTAPTEEMSISKINIGKETMKLKDEIIGLQKRTIENLEVRCNLYSVELERLKAEVRNFQKDCKYKKNCLIKNLNVGNDVEA